MLGKESVQMCRWNSLILDRRLFRLLPPQEVVLGAKKNDGRAQRTTCGGIRLRRRCYVHRGETCGPGIKRPLRKSGQVHGPRGWQTHVFEQMAARITASFKMLPQVRTRQAGCGHGEEGFDRSPYRSEQVDGSRRQLRGSTLFAGMLAMAKSVDSPSRPELKGKTAESDIRPC